MADSFELLRARITIDVSNVKAASLAVAKLQTSLNQLSKPIKINLGDTTRATRGGSTPAEKIAKATEAANQAELRSTQRTAKEIERIRLESYKKIIRAAQKLEIIAKSPATSERDRARLLSQAENLLIKVRQRVSAVSREAIQVERNLASVRRAAEPGIDRLAAKLRSLANITDAASRAPGVSNFVANIARLGSGLLRAVASISKLGASAIALTAGVAALGVGLALGVSLMIKLASAAVRAAVALGRTVLTAAITALGSALKLILTPIRAVYAELRRLFSIAGMRAFVTETLELAGRMEQIRQQLQLGFGGEADAEFARLRQEADLFGSSLIDLSQSFAKFSLVAKQAGVDIATIRKLFTGIQAAGRVFGINADDLQGIFRALEQISSKGKLTSEELIRQLGDRLPGAFALAARALNRSSAQLVEDLREGTVSAQEFFKAFADQTVLEFYEQAVSLSDNLNARLQRLRNLSDRVKVAFGNIFSNTIVLTMERVAQAAIRTREAFAPLSQAVQQMVNSFRDSLLSINFEAVFERLAGLLKTIIEPLKRFGDRLARIGILFNGAALAAAFAGIAIAIDKINIVMDLMLKKFQALTGIDLSTPERAVAAFAATLEVLPRIMDRVRLMGVIVQVTFANVFRAIGNFFSKLTTISSTFFKFFAVAAQNMFGWLIPDQVIDSWKQMIATMSTAAGEISTQISSEIEGMFEDIAEAQKGIKAALNGPEAERSKAAEGLKGAAKEIEAAMKGEAAEILDPLEWVRRLNSATFKANIEKPEVEQKQAAAAEETAKNTREILGMMRRGDQVTPLFGRVPGLV